MKGFNMSDLIEGYLGKTVERKKSRIPAKLDYLQSATGLILGLFMWGHMLLVSSILISKDFMYTITKLLEASFIFEGGNPLLVTFAGIADQLDVFTWSTYFNVSKYVV